MDGNYNARDQLIDALCEDGAYSADSAIYMAEAYRRQVLREEAAELRARGEDRAADLIDPKEQR